MVAQQDSTTHDRPDAKDHRTLAAILSAMVLSAIIWGVVVFFNVR
jgi:hypothetical protein